MAELGSTAKRLKNVAASAASRYAYHALHKRQAWQLIDSMTSRGGLRRDDALFEQCDAYARDVFGSDKYSPWLKAYTVLSGTFKEGWIPDNYYGAVVVERLKGAYGAVSDCKAISNRLFHTDLLPDVAYAVNGLLCTASLDRIEPGDLKKHLFDKTEKVVFKRDSGGQGKSVSVYDAGSFPHETTVFGNGVFQSYIVQHPFFDAFDTQSVSTLRLTTVVEDDLHVSCRAAYLRMPRRADTHVKSETAVKVVVNVADGRLGVTGYLPDWVPVTRHPDSNEAFADHVVPNFQGCVEACVALHRQMPFARTIGWDVVVDQDDRVAVMEWNGTHNDIKFSEAADGPCFADLGWQHLWRRTVPA
ncbi:MAG TPA: sugar-transfer associated ATP-grasp domain-containing protein [Acidimicrobiales bacterium]|nr:sugar-transfer associated ATP-grasp domain-containing protein [Acidimicrobiales bacterium]